MDDSQNGSPEADTGGRAHPWLTRSALQWLGLVAGPLLALAVYLVLPEVYQAATGRRPSCPTPPRATAATGVWMAVLAGIAQHSACIPSR